MLDMYSFCISIFNRNNEQVIFLYNFINQAFRFTVAPDRGAQQ